MFFRQGEAGKHVFLFVYFHSVKTPTIEDGEMNADMVHLQCPSTYLMKIKPPVDVTDFERSELCEHNSKSGRNYAKAKLIDHEKIF